MAAIAAVLSFRVDECVIIFPKLLFDEWFTDLCCSCSSRSRVPTNQFYYSLIKERNKVDNLFRKCPSKFSWKRFRSNLILQSKKKGYFKPSVCYSVSYFSQREIWAVTVKWVINTLDTFSLKNLQDNPSPYSESVSTPHEGLLPAHIRMPLQYSSLLQPPLYLVFGKQVLIQSKSEVLTAIFFVTV